MSSPLARALQPEILRRSGTNADLCGESDVARGWTSKIILSAAFPRNVPTGVFVVPADLKD
jgi:hypothetical protein